MPYPADAEVPTALLRILDARVGRRAGAILLHDHLDDPRHLATRALLSVAIGGEVSISHGLGRAVAGGYAASMAVGFATTLSKRRWDGRTLVVDALPETIRAAAVGRPIGAVVDHPLLGDDIIEEADDEAIGRTTLTVAQKTTPMRDVAPGWATRRFAPLRRHLRRRAVARRIGAHAGFSPWMPLAGIVAAALAVMLAGVLAAMLMMPFLDRTSLNAVATVVAMAAAPIAAVATIWLLAGHVQLPNRVDEHLALTIQAAREKGL